MARNVFIIIALSGAEIKNRKKEIVRESFLFIFWSS
jgi:hypothetical protein